jgi:hypothetical protein
MVSTPNLFPRNWEASRLPNADSGEGNQYSGLIVISIPGWCDQSSERSDAGFCILQKVITIVK